MTEIEFKNKVDTLFLQAERLVEDLEKEFAYGYDLYKPVKNLHLLFGRMRRQIERQMNENGTA